VENAHTDGAHVPTEHPECPICADVTERAAEARMTDGDI
jgi:hypothetical protein